MQKIINIFWKGKISLWKSFWLIMMAHSLLLQHIIRLVEYNLIGNQDIFLILNYGNTKIPLLNFAEISFFSKLIIISTTIFVTVGTWRSAENYKGPFWLIVITLFYIGYNNFIILYFVIINLFK